jgi:hypothetical protein
MRSFSVSGDVVVKETQQPVAGLVVVASWVGDAGATVRAGSALTDATGGFELPIGESDGQWNALRVHVEAPLGSPVDKPLATSPIRAVMGNRETFRFWIAEATLREAGVRVSRASAGAESLLESAVADQRRRAEFEGGLARAFVPRLEAHRDRRQALRVELGNRLRKDAGLSRPGRPRVALPDQGLVAVLQATARDGVQSVAAGRPTRLRLAIADSELEALRTAPGSATLDRDRVEALVFADGARARVREDAFARWCAQLLRPLPPLQQPPIPPQPVAPPAAPVDFETTLAGIVDAIARRTAPTIEARADEASIGGRLRALDLAVGPADRSALFDYGVLVGTIDGVWQELFDEELIDAALEVEQAVSAGGGRLAATGAVIAELHREFHALAAVAGGPNARARNSDRSRFSDGPFASFLEGIFGRPQVQDHRGDSPPVVGPRSTRGPLWTDEPPTPEYDALLEDLRERLEEPYTFQVFAASEDDRAFDFGLFVSYRQRWEPRGHQAGALVKTVTLAPREERTYTTRTTFKRSSSSVQATNLERSDRTETQDTYRSAADLVAATKSSLGFEVTNEGSVGIGELFSADGSARLTQTTEQSSQETRQFVREGVRRAAQEARSSMRTEVTTTESSEVFTEESGKIVNPNEELPVTYLFYELQRRFRVSERIHRAMPVVMVARAVPRPDQITRAWLFAHGWILRRALLDEQFAAPLSYLLHDAAGVEARLGQLRQHRDGLRRLVDALTGEVETRSRDAASRYGALGRAIDLRLTATSADGNDGIVERAVGAVMGSDNSVEVARLREQMARDAYEQALRAESDARDRLSQASSSLEVATREHTEAVARFRDQELAVKRLRVHVKGRILHYMRAIWNAEDRDQRYFELHSVRVPRLAGHLEYRVVETSGVPPMPPLWRPPHTVEATLVPDEVDPMRDTVRLGDIADLEHPIGYKGNFQVFPMRRHNVLTQFLMLPYLDHRVGACDPDLLANVTLTELDTYVECARQALAAEQFAAILPRIHELYQAVLARPFPDEEEIVVPTGSTFIEALPGARPVLEDFRLLHRAIDVSRVAADVRRRELDNLRRVALIRAGHLGDPDIETMVVAPTGTNPIVAPSVEPIAPSDPEVR